MKVQKQRRGEEEETEVRGRRCRNLHLNSSKCPPQKRTWKRGGKKLNNLRLLVSLMDL